MIVRIRHKVEHGGQVTLTAWMCEDDGHELWQLEPGDVSQSGDTYDVLLPGVEAWSMITVS